MPSSKNDTLDHADTLSLAGGRIICLQCAGTSRRTKKRCLAPAESGSRWCRFHGGRNRGPTTREGRAKCAAAKTVHGQENRLKRKRAQLQCQLIRALTMLSELLAGNPTQNQIHSSPLVPLVFDLLLALEEHDRITPPAAS